MDKTIDTEKQAALLFLEHLRLGLCSSLLIVNPISKKNEIPQNKIDFFISKALIKAEKQGFSGKELTPFLLETIRKETKGDSLKANNMHLNLTFDALALDPRLISTWSLMISTCTLHHE